MSGKEGARDGRGNAVIHSMNLLCTANSLLCGTFSIKRSRKYQDLLRDLERLVYCTKRNVTVDEPQSGQCNIWNYTSLIMQVSDS